jgi:hypothetical protein
MNFDERQRNETHLKFVDYNCKMSFHIYSGVPPLSGTRTAEHVQTMAVVKAAFLNNLCAVN